MEVGKRGKQVNINNVVVNTRIVILNELFKLNIIIKYILMNLGNKIYG